MIEDEINPHKVRQIFLLISMFVFGWLAAEIKNELREEVEEHPTEEVASAPERRDARSAAHARISADRRLLRMELRRLAKLSDVRSRAAVETGRIRLNKIELALAIMDSSLVQELYRKYVGKDIMPLLFECRRAASERLGGSTVPDEKTCQAIEETGSLYTKRCLAEIDAGLKKWKEDVETNAALDVSSILVESGQHDSRALSADEFVFETPGIVYQLPEQAPWKTTCQSPEKCYELADQGEEFCPRHRCHSVGCHAHVESLAIPEWIDFIRLSQLTELSEKRQSHKMLGRYCRDHMCQRKAPPIPQTALEKTRSNWFSLRRVIDDDTRNYDFFYCDAERLPEVPYCADHACDVENCTRPRQESWQDVTGPGARRTATGTGMNFFRGLRHVCEETCAGHKTDKLNNGNEK